MQAARHKLARALIPGVTFPQSVMASDVSEPLAYSLALCAVASAWALKYWAARRRGRYAAGRRPAGGDDRFRRAGRVIFVASNLLTLASFWTETKALLPFAQGGGWRLAGLGVLTAATLLQIRSLKDLGQNYSPCFDAYVPRRIVTRGAYRYVRHPLYLANLLLGAGHTLASGSLWVLALSVYGAVKILRALAREESYLSAAFPAYDTYRAKTARLIPFIY